MYTTIGLREKIVQVKIARNILELYIMVKAQTTRRVGYNNVLINVNNGFMFLNRENAALVRVKGMNLPITVYTSQVKALSKCSVRG